MKIKRWHIITTLCVIVAALFSFLKYIGVISRDIYLFPGLFSVFMVIAAFVYFLPLRGDTDDHTHQ